MLLTITGALHHPGHLSLLIVLLAAALGAITATRTAARNILDLSNLNVCAAKRN